MGVRVTKESLVRQLELTGQLDFLELPYHRAILEDRIPLSIGGGIGQSRVTMLLLRKAHLGEVSVTVWPRDPEGDVRRTEHRRARVTCAPVCGEPSAAADERHLRRHHRHELHVRVDSGRVAM